MKPTKITLSNDVVNFINNFNKIHTTTASQKGEKLNSEVLWVNCYFKTTEEDNVFEVLTETDLIVHYCKSNEITDKGVSNITKRHIITYETKDNN